jgi:primase-polymerase (primpol)-like protein
VYSSIPALPGARRKETVLKFIITDVIPPELTELRQWLLWRYEYRFGRWTKIPYTPAGKRASSTNPADWTTLEAVSIARAHCPWWDGIGFVFSENDPYCGIDLDDIWASDADESAPPAWAAEILEHFSDTYHEESPGLNGVKCWCRAQLPEHRGREWKIGSGAIEIYDRARFFTVTGRCGAARGITDHQSDVDSLIQHLDSGAGTQVRSNVIAIDNKIRYGTQHHRLVSLAGSMWRRGLNVAAIEAALQVVNAQQCERPGPPENIHKIALSAARWDR